MTRDRPIGTTKKQKEAVDNILSGEYPTKKAAMKAAGYAENSARIPQESLARREGVKKYLAMLDKKAKKRWNLPIREKVMDVYADGLEATKLYGKDAIEHPDHGVRIRFADRLASFFGWVDSFAESGSAKAQYQQFNFFSVDEKRRDSFNENFKKFLKGYYGKS